MSIPLMFQVGQWQYQRFGCFDDIRLCLFTFVAPCITFGKNAEASGAGPCMTCGKLAFVL